MNTPHFCWFPIWHSRYGRRNGWDNTTSATMKPAFEMAGTHLKFYWNEGAKIKINYEALSSM